MTANKPDSPPPAGPQPESKVHPFIELSTKDIDFIADQIHRNARLHGFHAADTDERTFINEQLNNLHDEISELHEAWRRGELRAPCDKAEQMKAMGLPPLSNLEEELADIIIRVLDEARQLKVNISRAIAIKHLFNVTRPYKHGKLS